MPFSTLGLSAPLTAVLARKGYAQPTPVQSAAIPLVLAGRDLIARAQTGTGKTAAFALPILERLIFGAARPFSPRRPRALVLVPTRELAAQVHDALMSYGGPAGLRSAMVCGGVAMRPQVMALQRGVHVLVATPGRLIDHMQQRTIDLGAVEMLVLDEGDRMLDLGFMPAIRRIVQALPRARQTLLFSATFPEDLLRAAADLTRDPERVDVSSGEVAHTVEHEACAVVDGTKSQTLAALLGRADAGQAIVFCKTKRGSNRVGEQLERHGLKAVVIHGNKSQNARTRALAEFKSKRVAVLVATDIAARGLDIPQLPLVVNYDLPLVAADYVHRVGRTGRAGLQGRAVSLVSPGDRPLLRDIERLLNQSIRVTGGPATQPQHESAAPRMAAVPRVAPAARSAHGPRPGPANHARPARRPQWRPEGETRRPEFRGRGAAHARPRPAR